MENQDSSTTNTGVTTLTLAALPHFCANSVVTPLSQCMAIKYDKYQKTLDKWV